MAVLGKLDINPGGPRGLDVCWTVTIEPDWLVPGTALLLDLPRRLPCAACSGGGCDACGRTGVVTLRDAEEQAPAVRVELGETLRGAEGAAVRLQIPDHGGPGEGELPRGLLQLTLQAGEPSHPDRVRLAPKGRSRGMLRFAPLPWALLLICLLAMVLWVVSQR